MFNHNQKIKHDANIFHNAKKVIVPMFIQHKHVNIFQSVDLKVNVYIYILPANLENSVKDPIASTNIKLEQTNEKNQ